MNNEKWKEKMENDPEKQETICTPEEAAAYLNDMTLDEWLKATAPHRCPKCMRGHGCTKEPCTKAYESLCDSCIEEATPEPQRDRVCQCLER